MKKNHDVMGMVKMFLFSAIAALAITAVLLVVAAFLLEKTGLSQQQSRLLVYAIYIISAMVSGMLSGKWKGEQKYLWGALSGMILFLLILGISLGINGTQIEVKELFPAFISLAGGGMLGGMLA